MTGLRNLLAALPVFLCVLVAGCGKDVFISLVPPTPATTGTGNWFFSGYYADGCCGIVPYYFGGSLINNGGQLSGVLHIDQSCFGSYATDVPYTGTLDGKNNLSITSSPISGQILTLQGTMSADASTLNGGTFSVARGCAGGILSGTFGSGPFAEETQGIRVPGLTGTWTSSPTTGGGLGISVTEQLTQSSTPDAHGDYALTGTMTVQGSPCFTKGTLQTTSFVSGEEGHELLLMDDGSTLDASLMVSFVANQTKPILGLEQAVIAGGKCNGELNVNLQ